VSDDTSKKKTYRKRRGRGEGSVFEREDGLWVGSISLGLTESGKRNRKVVYGATKREVLDELDRLRSEARVGSLPDAGGLTVGQLLDRWLATSKVSTGIRIFDDPLLLLGATNLFHHLPDLPLPAAHGEGARASRALEVT
jgi:hypothetical protein